jgi:uncharacterized protein
MEVEEHEHGVPCWVDLGAPNPDKAAQFYESLFGWDIQEGPPEAGGYRMCLLKGRPVAGLSLQMNPGPSVWSTYVKVNNADEVAEKVTNQGGLVLQAPFDVMDFGRMAVFMDPAGAPIAVWQPGQHKGAGVVSEPGAYGWSELLTTDPDAATAFYSAVFGWEAELQEGEPHGYRVLTLGDRPVGGMMPKPMSIPGEVPSHWMVYFTVEDAVKTLERVGELGGGIQWGPVNIPQGRFGVASDPDGAVFSVIQMSDSDRANAAKTHPGEPAE